MPRPSGLSRLWALIVLTLALLVTACASVESGSTVVVVARCEDGSTSQTSGTDGTETTGTSETETTGNGETGASTEPGTEGIS